MLTTKTLITDKISDLKQEIAQLKIRDDISKNTRGTQLYAKNRELRVLQLIDELIDEDTELSEEAHDTLCLITTLREERAKSSRIILTAGSYVLDVLSEHPNLNKKRLEELCEKQCMRIDYATGMLVSTEGAVYEEEDAEEDTESESESESEDEDDIIDIDIDVDTE